MKTAWILLVAGCGFQSPPGMPGETDGSDGTATAPDASFDYASCPASYNVTALPGPSRYRLIIDGHRAWEQSDACNQDMPVATHLVVIETTQELAAVVAFVKTPGAGIAGNALWIGGVQPKTARFPSDGWLGFDGQRLINGWGVGEPNDKGNDENNHEEQFVKMQQDKAYFIDTAGTDNIGALCECDGKSIAPTVASVIDSYRPPT